MQLWTLSDTDPVKYYQYIVVRKGLFLQTRWRENKK